MSTAEIVNRIISKLGGNSVEFLEIETIEYNCILFSVCKFVHATHIYEARAQEDAKNITVKQEFRDQGPLVTNAYSTWIEGVLNGLSRNDAGELVRVKD